MSLILQKLEEEPYGLISKQLLYGVLSTVASRPIKYELLDEVVENIMSGKTEMTRREIR